LFPWLERVAIDTHIIHWSQYPSTHIVLFCERFSNQILCQNLIPLVGVGRPPRGARPPLVGGSFLPHQKGVGLANQDIHDGRFGGHSVAIQENVGIIHGNEIAGGVNPSVFYPSVKGANVNLADCCELGFCDEFHFSFLLGRCYD